MMQFNISPETWKGKKTMLDITTTSGHILKAGDGDIQLASGSIFNNSEDSVLRKVLKDLYGRRKNTKHKYLQVAKEIDTLKKYID